jgi:hypothetical protein
VSQLKVVLNWLLTEIVATDGAEEEEADEILDRLEDATDKNSIVRQLSSRQVQACLVLASENARDSRNQAVADLQKELMVRCPC